MDDAGSGTRGLKPRLTAAHARAAARTWGLALDGAVPLGGSTGLNLLVDSPPGRPVVLRIHRHHVSRGRVEALQFAREAAAEAGVPTASPVLGRHGERVVAVGATVLEVERFVESDQKMDTMHRIRQAMPTFARLHDALSSVQLPDAADDLRFANYLPADGLESTTSAGADRLRSLGSTLRPLADHAERLVRDLSGAQATLEDLEPQWCHGDFWDDNVLFRDGAIALVADFGFLNRRPRVDDLALTLYFTLWDLSTRAAAAQGDPVEHLAALVRAYDEGARRPLSGAEREALPLAVARQPLWSIGVWARQLDDPATIRAHLDGHEIAFELVEGILRDLDHWRISFAV